MKPLHQLTYLSLLFLNKLVCSLSERRRYKLSIYISKLFFNLIPIRKNIAKKNIQKAFPEWTEKKINLVLKNSYNFFCYNLIQFIGFPKTLERVKFIVKGKNIIDRYLQNGNGIIMVTGHYGAWEILGKWLGEYAKLFTGIAFKQKNLGAHNFFIEQREYFGTKHIFTREPLEKMYDVLKKNGILGIVSDQDAGKKGIFVDFFKTPASTAKGAALFHINRGSPIVVAVCMRTGFDRYRIEFIPIENNGKNIQSITQSYTKILEEYIKIYPEQYFWFHRRWKTNLK